MYELAIIVVILILLILAFYYLKTRKESYITGDGQIFTNVQADNQTITTQQGPLITSTRTDLFDIPLAGEDGVMNIFSGTYYQWPPYYISGSGPIFITYARSMYANNLKIPVSLGFGPQNKYGIFKLPRTFAISDIFLFASKILPDPYPISSPDFSVNIILGTSGIPEYTSLASPTFQPTPQPQVVSIYGPNHPGPNGVVNIFSDSNYSTLLTSLPDGQKQNMILVPASGSIYANNMQKSRVALQVHQNGSYFNMSFPSTFAIPNMQDFIDAHLTTLSSNALIYVYLVPKL